MIHNDDRRNKSSLILWLKFSRPLGDDIQPEYLINIIKDLYEKALLDLGASNFQLLSVITNVKIIGSNLLNNISLTLDKLMKILKLAGISLLFISLSLLLLNMLLS